MTGQQSPLAAVRAGWRHVTGRLEDVLGGPARVWVIAILAGVLGLQTADQSAVGATAPEIEQALRIGNTEIGLLVTVASAVGALATLPLGVLADRVNRTRLLAAAIVGWSLAMAVSGAATSYLMLLLARLAVGAVAGAAGPVVASLLGDLFPAAERGRIYGFVLTGELLGTGFGYLVAGGIAGALSWRYSFWVLAVPGLAIAYVLIRRLPEPARGGQSWLWPGATEIPAVDGADEAERSAAPEPATTSHPDRGEGEVGEGALEEAVRAVGIRPRRDQVLHEDPSRRSLWWSVRYVLSIRTNVLLIVASALGYFFFAGLRTFGVIYLRDRFGLGQAAANSLLVALGAGAVIGVLLTGRWADRLIGRGHLSARPVVAGASIIVAALLFLPALLLPALVMSAPFFFLAAVGLGGANPPLDAARLDIMPSTLRGRAEAVRTVSRSGLEAAAPLLFGYLSTLLGGPGGSGGFGGGPAATQGSGAAANSSAAAGLVRTFLIMLIPLFVAGLLGVVWARVTYLRDVATATLSERNSAPPRPTDASADPSTDPTADPSTDPTPDPSTDPTPDPSTDPSGG